jgi:hypothetical protein
MGEIWTVQWHGPRGGKWTTESLTEEKAREKFTSLGESCYAILLKQTGTIPGFGPMNEVKERNKVAQLLSTEGLLKDHLKHQARTQKAIDACRESIKELKKQIKAARNGS